uniref:Uncharacterized protein n=1 Tax=Oryza glumipatula TaxID=40148 RepID=A0A0E0BH28_9ORYZ
MADLSFANNWDFSPGEGFAREVKNRFSSTVHFSPGFSDVRPFKLVFYSCQQFHLFFHLWRNGGPDWYKEYSQWIIEQDKEWTTVKPKTRSKSALVKPGVSFAKVVRSKQVETPFVIPVKKAFNSLKKSFSVHRPSDKKDLDHPNRTWGFKVFQSCSVQFLLSLWAFGLALFGPEEEV